MNTRKIILQIYKKIFRLVLRAFILYVSQFYCNCDLFTVIVSIGWAQFLLIKMQKWRTYGIDADRRAPLMRYHLTYYVTLAGLVWKLDTPYWTYRDTRDKVFWLDLSSLSSLSHLMSKARHSRGRLNLKRFHLTRGWREKNERKKGEIREKTRAYISTETKHGNLSIYGRTAHEVT